MSDLNQILFEELVNLVKYGATVHIMDLAKFNLVKLCNDLVLVRANFYNCPSCLKSKHDTWFKSGQK